MYDHFYANYYLLESRTRKLNLVKRNVMESFMTFVCNKMSFLQTFTMRLGVYKVFYS